MFSAHSPLRHTPSFTPGPPGKSARARTNPTTTLGAAGPAVDSSPPAFPRNRFAPGARTVPVHQPARPATVRAFRTQPAEVGSVVMVVATASSSNCAA
uniref:Uncharacterized protein n=1 Tax=Anopheles quadriannulatus TaxID=34691 RepID=A0A182XRB9_ANOQN